MAVRERLHRLALSSATVATARRVRTASRILLLAGLVFVLLRLRTLWRDSHVALGHVGWPSLVAAVALAAAATAASAFIWLAILRWLGATPRARWACIFLQAQLGKYIPGGVWQYAGRTTLARTHGVPLRAAALSLPAEFVGSSLVAALFSILILGWWGTVAVSGALIAGQLAFRSRSISGRLRTGQPARAALRSLPLYVAGWTLTGTSFWLTARALVAAPVSDIPVYVGAFAAAWLVGVLAIFAPGGLGVREALLVALLRGRLGTADALVLATASRAVLTFVDAGMAGLGFLVLRRSADSRQFETALEPPASSQ